MKLVTAAAPVVAVATATANAQKHYRNNLEGKE